MEHTDSKGNTIPKQRELQPSSLQTIPNYFSMLHATYSNLNKMKLLENLPIESDDTFGLPFI